jgi:hypothetical protein
LPLFIFGKGTPIDFPFISGVAGESIPEEAYDDGVVVEVGGEGFIMTHSAVTGVGRERLVGDDDDGEFGVIDLLPCRGESEDVWYCSCSSCWCC